MSLKVLVAGRAVVPLLTAAALVSCGTVDPALREKIEEVWNQPAAHIVYENGDVKPWAVGQWTRARIDDGGTRGIRTVLVAKAVGSAYWLEFQEIWPDRETAAAVLVDHYRPGHPGDLKVLRLKLRRQTGEIAELGIGEETASSPEAQETLLRLEAALDGLRHRSETGVVQDVTVPAGEFRNTLTRPLYATRGGSKFRGFVWYSNAVPVSSFVKIDVKQPLLEVLSHRKTIEVVAFGDHGVESVLFD